MNEIYLAYKASRESEDHLEHHGIKGQKWGVRRFQNPDGTRIGAKKRKPKKEKEPERGPVHKKFKERYDTLDDDELKRRNNRMIEEQKYRRMQDELYPDKRAQRRARIKKAISEAMTESLKEVTKATATAVGKRIMDSIFGTNMSGQGKKKGQNDQNENQKKDKDKNQNGQQQNSNSDSNPKPKKDKEQKQKEKENEYKRAADIINRQNSDESLHNWQKRLSDNQRKLRRGKYKFKYYS